MAVSGMCLLCSSICQVGVLNTLKESQSAYLEDFVIQHARGMERIESGWKKVNAPVSLDKPSKLYKLSYLLYYKIFSS